MMRKNADFSQRSLLHTTELEWQASPMKGVHRQMLDRVGGEVARATSMVKYGAGTHFSPHSHTGGEEFIVIDGVFQDEHGDYPQGYYVRNPPNSSHTPRSDAGCTIFVKLWQFDLNDRQSVCINMNNRELQLDQERAHVSFSTLFSDERETVRLEHWQADSVITLDTRGGIELLVLDGDCEDSGTVLKRLSWLRVPIGGDFRATVGPCGARVWIKSGHLRFAEEQVLALHR